MTRFNAHVDHQLAAGASLLDVGVLPVLSGSAAPSSGRSVVHAERPSTQTLLNAVPQRWRDFNYGGKHSTMPLIQNDAASNHQNDEKAAAVAQLRYLADLLEADGAELQEAQISTGPSSFDTDQKRGVEVANVRLKFRRASRSGL